MGFVLEFLFAENEYFEDRILTKTYEMKSEPDDFDPVAFDGPEIVGSTGCTINWKKGLCFCLGVSVIRVIRKGAKF